MTDVILAAHAVDPTLQTFENDVWWISLIKLFGVFVLLLLLTLFTIVYERKVVARMAVRPGPNQVGPKGWLQSLTDGVKLPFKEEIIPKTADKVVYFIAPVISATVAFTAFSVIPFGGPDDLVRGRDGSEHRGGLHDRGHHEHLADRRRPGG